MAAFVWSVITHNTKKLFCYYYFPCLNVFIVFCIIGGISIVGLGEASEELRS